MLQIGKLTRKDLFITTKLWNNLVTGTGIPGFIAKFNPGSGRCRSISTFVGGWFNPEALTPARFADGFERVDGIYSGFRLNHAEGVCVSDSFESNGRGTRLSKAVVWLL